MLEFLRDDEDAGRWEDENSVRLTANGIEM